jgi:hypothetical protein
MATTVKSIIHLQNSQKIYFVGKPLIKAALKERLVLLQTMYFERGEGLGDFVTLLTTLLCQFFVRCNSIVIRGEFGRHEITTATVVIS